MKITFPFLLCYRKSVWLRDLYAGARWSRFYV